MKCFSVFIILIFSIGTWACDQVLLAFPRDCQLQDRLRSVKAEFQSKGINAEEIAEYRVLRFVDRGSWERAKSAGTAPIHIYKPAPATWEVWDAGIRQIFANPMTDMNSHTFADMNRVLLTDGSQSIKDPRTDRSKRPGEFRTGSDLGVGFCHRNVQDSSEILKKAKLSSLRYQHIWEQKTGIDFRQLVKGAGGPAYEEASLAAGMTQSDHPGCKSPNSWVSFVPTKEVQQQVDWLLLYTHTNLQLINERKAAPSPVELAAFVQRWFVTIHPFSDGNGRTSRAVQDVLLNAFELPFAPAGDLYNDATTEWESYLEQTYRTMESMLTVLENCSRLDYSRAISERPFYCATVEELNRL